MFKSGLSPIEFRPRRLKALPGVGQQVLVRVQKEIELWQGSQRVRYREGHVFMGTVEAVGDDGLLDLHLIGGQLMHVHARDVAFAIEQYEG